VVETEGATVSLSARMIRERAEEIYDGVIRL